ncbi:MAG: hypothetical protein VX681_08905 [Myxococcota bacterium]|nr:hypothetical protein [Myxococcota bacterium]
MRLSIAIGSAVALLGCTTLTPASFRAKPPEFDPIQGGPVVVLAGYTEPEAWRFNANGITFDYNRNAFSEDLARLVSGALSGAGVAVGEGGDPITVRVVYLDFMFQGPCIVDYAVKYGESAWAGGQARYESSNFATACREALELAAHDIVADPRTQLHLGED